VSRKRINRHVRGEHLVVTHDGDVLHSDQVTIGLYGAQKGQVVDIDDLDGPDSQTMQRNSRERLAGRPPRRLKDPITGPEDEQ
jgi:hypothetical protein